MKNGTARLSEQWITELCGNKGTWERFTSARGWECGLGVLRRVSRIKAIARAVSLEAFFPLLHPPQCAWQLNRMQMGWDDDVYNLHWSYRVNHCPEWWGTWKPSDRLGESALLPSICAFVLCFLFSLKLWGMLAVLCSLDLCSPSSSKKKIKEEINTLVKYI